MSIEIVELKILSDWNPWWYNLDGISKLIGVMRPRYKLLYDAIKIKEILILTGIRRSGKSTLMYQIIQNLISEKIPVQNILYINLEDPNLVSYTLDEIYNSYKSDFEIEGKCYIFLDEIHKKGGWEKWIRKKYDIRTEDKFIISSSSAYLLEREYSTLLTGRNLTFQIFPLNFGEILDFNKIEFDKLKIEKGIYSTQFELKIIRILEKYLKEGGFPEIFSKVEQFKKLLLIQYYNDILYKDIIDRYNSNSQITNDLAQYFITNFTNEFSLRKIRDTMGISYNSTKLYLSYFKEAFLFFTIEHFSYSLKKQKTYPSKIYVIDNGLRNAVAFKFSEDLGRLAENLVLLHLKQLVKDVYYWHGKNAVDFIVKNNNNSLDAINISYTDNINERELKGLTEFKSKYKSNLILITRSIEDVSGNIKIVPLWKWLLTNI